MGCMIARRLGLSSCAVLFISGVFGGFLLAGMLVSPTIEPIQIGTAPQAPSALSSSGSGLSAPSAPLPRPATRDELETFEPVIRAPLTNVKSTPEKIPRPRFYSTELGTHQKLYVAVLTSPETVQREACNINNTLAHITTNIGFYMVGPPDTELPKNLHNVVIFPQETEDLALKTAQYLADNHARLYDFIFMVRDNTYVRGYRLKELAEDLSVSTDVLLGARRGGQCRLDGGLLMSRQLLMPFSEQAGECGGGQPGGADGQARSLIDCLERHAGSSCADGAQGKAFVSHPLASYDPARDGDQPGLISIQGVHSAGEHSRLHAAFSRLEIGEIDQRISRLREALEANHRNMHALMRSKMGDDAADDEPEPLPWPVGSRAPTRSTSRHHINLWERFSETQMYLRTPLRVVDPLTEAERLDIQDVLELGMAEVQKSGQFRLVKLKAGYRRFDGARGMDYILDLEVQPADGDTTQIHRVEVHRPILKAELLPIPFVTEKPTLSIIMPVTPEQVGQAEEFVQHLITNKDNVGLMLFLIAGDSDSSVFSPLMDLLKQANGRRPSMPSRRFDSLVWRQWPSPSQFDIVDAVAAATGGQWRQAMVLLLGQPIEYNAELLNRARMQTIRGWEVFCPIPWVEYNPDIVYKEGRRTSEKLDLNKNHGFFDGDHYAMMSFYMEDYAAVREKADGDISAALGPGGTDVLPYDLYGAFVKFSGLHVHRAVDHTFRLFYFERSCPNQTRYFHQQACTNSKLFGLGPHEKLSKLLDEYREARRSAPVYANAV